jgi:hypothetical protein
MAHDHTSVSDDAAPRPDRRRTDRLVRGALLGAAGGTVVAALLSMAVGCSSGEEVTSAAGGAEPVEAASQVSGRDAATARPGALVVRVAGTGAAVDVVVDDPARPTGPDARQCALVRLRSGDGGAVAAEGSACGPSAGEAPATSAPEGTVTAELRRTDVLQIADACAMTPPPDGDPADGATAAATTFRFALPFDLPAGTYEVEVGATSGVGDGCVSGGEPDAGWEREASATGSVTVG